MPKRTRKELEAEVAALGLRARQLDADRSEARAEVRRLRAGIQREAERLADTTAELIRIREAIVAREHELQQTLGRALGYPRFADDPVSFPEATDADGVCVGDHVSETLALEAAERIRRLEQEAKRQREPSGGFDPDFC